MSVFFKTAGGKRQLLSELRKYVPESFDRYFEPFVGGGALYFDLASNGRIGKCGAYLNDINGHMMATYTAVRDDLTRLVTRLVKHENYYIAANAKERLAYFTLVRAQHNVKGLEAAARFLFLNRTCFNGLYRVNLKGEFNVPHGRYDNPTICDEPKLRAASIALKSVHLTCQDFEIATRTAKRGDFLFADCPYWPASASSDFTAYNKAGFGPAEQVRLRDHALSLKKQGVHVMLTNADVKPVRQLYSNDFEIHRVQARRSINSKTEKRGSVGELIIT